MRVVNPITGGYYKELVTGIISKGVNAIQDKKVKIVKNLKMNKAMRQLGNTTIKGYPKGKITRTLIKVKKKIPIIKNIRSTAAQHGKALRKTVRTFKGSGPLPVNYQADAIKRIMKQSVKFGEQKVIKGTAIGTGVAGVVIGGLLLAKKLSKRERGKRISEGLKKSRKIRGRRNR